MMIQYLGNTIFDCQCTLLQFTLSVSRLARLTNCYPNTSSPLILGERYRFGLQGFNYPTGGAGILINKAALHILALECTCLRPDSPDDMIIGACADTLKIPLIHVPQLHQVSFKAT